jgi:hypothetical protein
MIQPTWQGPITTHKNRVLMPGKPIDLAPNDPQLEIFRRMGYIKAPPPAPPETPAPKQKKGE